MKIAVAVLMLAIVASLASGLVFLIKDPSGSRRTARALTLRIGLSLGLFALLMLAFAMGLISPHGVLPPP